MGPPRALTVAGSDSGGGAGIAADLRTFAAHGCWGMCAVTAVTAQNTLGVQAAQPVEPGLVAAQIDSVALDIGVDAAKTGMLATAATVSAVAAALRRHKIESVVVDPVLVGKHGDSLLAEDALAALREELIPLATVVTPNLSEASRLSGIDVRDESTMRDAAEAIGALGARAVLLKGGHLEGDPIDVLWRRDGALVLRGERIPVRHTHGTGCVLSAALAARLARGEDLDVAVHAARDYVRAAIRGALAIGRGVGPVSPPLSVS